MALVNKLKLGFLALLLCVPVLPSVSLAGEEEGRAPPEARTAGTLSEQVMRSISRIQEMMSPEDDSEPPDYEGAKIELDELRERRWDRMNDFEKSTLLSFYTNYYLSQEDYPGAIRTFEEILLIEELREDQRLRTLRSLGQLYGAEENWQGSINNYAAWRELSLEEDDVVFKGLAYAHYQLDELAEALPYWLQYMQFVLDNGEELPRSDYAFLSGLYFGLEDFPSAEELLKTMIVRFDDPIDWTNLSAVYSELGNDDRRIQLMNIAYLKGYLDDDTEFMNISQSLAGIEIPLSGAKIMIDGMDQNIVERDADNMTTLTQMYLIASDYVNAEEPARQAAELDPTGDGFDTLGYVQYILRKYEDAVTSFEAALDKGQLSDRANTLRFLAMSLVELDEFDRAKEVTSDWAEAGDRDDQEAASTYMGFIDNVQSRYNILAERKADAIDFWEEYPPLQ